MELMAYWKANFVPFIRAQFGRSERGAALVEYALLVALIAVVCIAAISLLGNSAKSKFSDVGGSIANAGS